MSQAPKSNSANAKSDCKLTSSSAETCRKKRGGNGKQARKIHKWLAYLVGFTLFWLSITGILLNHTSDLGFNKSQVTQHWLLSWYNITPPTIEKAYAIPSAEQPESWLIATDKQRFWNETPIKQLNQHGKLYQVVLHEGLIFLLQDKSIALLTQDGDLVDTLDTPEALLRLLQMQIPVTFYTNEDMEILISTQSTPENSANNRVKNHQAWWISGDFSDLSSMPKVDISTWTALTNHTTKVPPDSLNQAVQEQFTSNLTVEKVILELHNGYFFGKPGSWLLDIITLLFLVMVITGLRLTLKK